jgi:hypothetical protein
MSKLEGGLSVEALSIFGIGSSSIAGSDPLSVVLGSSDMIFIPFGQSNKKKRRLSAALYQLPQSKRRSFRDHQY